jgi:ribosomal protein S27E
MGSRACRVNSSCGRLCVMGHYPRPGTRGEKILEFIRLNPGCSRNAIIRHMGGGNSGSLESVLSALRRSGTIVREVDPQTGYHSYTAPADPLPQVDYRERRCDWCDHLLHKIHDPAHVVVRCSECPDGICDRSGAKATQKAAS